MKKSVCSLILLALLISESCISEINSDYGKIYQNPAPETTFLSDKVTQLDNGFLVKTGTRNYSIPFVEVYASNGLSFTSWELPFDEKICDYLYPMVTACGNTLCLFLNDKLEFFLPDGEYLRSQTLVPSINTDPSREIIDMSFSKQKSQIHFLVKYDYQPFLSWYIYSTNGTLLSSDEWIETSSTNSTFFTCINNEIIIGVFINNSISLFHRDGTFFTDYQIHETLNKIYESLKLLFGEKTSFYFSDIIFAKSNVWVQSNKGMLCFDLEGILIHAPLAFDAELNNTVSGRLNNDTFFCQVNDNDFATFYASGAQAGRCFFRQYYEDCDKLISVTQDVSSNWWTVYQSFSEGSTQSFLLKQTAEGKELNKWKINNEEIPTVFACNFQNPIALIGKKNVYPLSYFNSSSDENRLPWQHNIISNSNDKIVAAADKNNLIYLLNSSATDNIQVFSITGSYVRTYDGNALSLFPSKCGTVSALFLKPRFRFYLRNLYEDGSVSVGYQIKNNDNWTETFLSMFQLESGVIVVGLKDKIVFFAPIQKNKIKVTPRGTPIAIDYNSELNSLSIYGIVWQKKSAGSLYKKLSHYGKKLSKKSGDLKVRKKIYKKIFNFINKEKSKVNLGLKNTGNSQMLLSINAYFAAKHIKTQNIDLKYLKAKTGETPVSLNKLSLSKTSNCEVECGRLKKLNVKGDFSGNVVTWFGDIDSINIKGNVVNASFLSRRNIEKLVVAGNLSYLIARTGISPLGFSGISGDIGFVSSGENIENCKFIACADEGNNPDWSNDSSERFEGSIFSVRSKIAKAGNKFLPIGEVYNSLFISKNPINLLIQKKEGNTIIINGKKQN